MTTTTHTHKKEHLKMTIFYNFRKMARIFIVFSEIKKKKTRKCKRKQKSWKSQVNFFQHGNNEFKQLQ